MNPMASGASPYLTGKDFLKMLALALAAHGVVFAIAAWVPRDTVTHIPVRALSFKLGSVEKVAASSPVVETGMQMQAMAPVPPMPAVEPVVAAPEPAAEAMVKVAPIVPQTVPTPAKPAIAPTPQQYVREVGAAPTPESAVAHYEEPAAAGNPRGESMAVQAIRARYEQQISAWIQRHKFYPAGANGREGRAVVRMQIDRAGTVRYYAIEQSSGVSVLDAAALDMIRRANPMPAVPANYPDGTIVEFLIPITFEAPL